MFVCSGQRQVPLRRWSRVLRAKRSHVACVESTPVGVSWVFPLFLRKFQCLCLVIRAAVTLGSRALLGELLNPPHRPLHSLLASLSASQDTFFSDSVPRSRFVPRGSPPGRELRRASSFRPTSPPSTRPSSRAPIQQFGLAWHVFLLPPKAVQKVM